VGARTRASSISIALPLWDLCENPVMLLISEGAHEALQAPVIFRES
jgi:hypothetical protein